MSWLLSIDNHAHNNWIWHTSQTSWLWAIEMNSTLIMFKIQSIMIKIPQIAVTYELGKSQEWQGDYKKIPPIIDSVPRRNWQYIGVLRIDKSRDLFKMHNNITELKQDPFYVSHFYQFALFSLCKIDKVISIFIFFNNLGFHNF